MEQIAGRVKALSEYLSPQSEELDPENYAALKKLTEINRVLIDLPYSDSFEPGFRIEITNEIFSQAAQWNNGAVPAADLALIKDRVNAFNEGNIYLVDYHEVPIDGECYFSNHKEIAEHLAGAFMLTRSDNTAAAAREASSGDKGRGRGD